MTRPSLRPATRADRAVLTALLAGLSAESAYQRFQTGLGPGPSRGTVEALLPDGLHGRALLGLVDDHVVAHGLWVRTGSSRTAEIAIVVADGYQRQGIGTALARALIADLGARGIQRVEVFSGSGNQAVARMVAQNAPGATRTWDGPTVSYEFTVDLHRANAA